MFLAKRTLIQIAQIIESLFIKNINFFVICSSDQLGIIDIWVEDTLSDPSFFFTAKGIEEDLLLDKFINNNNKMYHLIKKIILPKFTKLHISGIEDIKDCYYEETKSGEWHVQTKGGNLYCLLYNPFIDHETTTTNDMWEIHRLFGIEATKKWLKQEFSNVLKVSHRHLDILVDKMTYMGGISSVSHYGLDRKIIGPLSKATFERALVTLLTAAQKSELDQLKSVSSCVATGKLGRFGTGMVDLIIDNDAIINNPYAQKIYSSQDIENMIEDLPDFEAEEDEDMITIDEPIELNDEDIY
jgi:DNA-directed RNA polymerase beta' subunit